MGRIIIRTRFVNVMLAISFSIHQIRLLSTRLLIQQQIKENPELTLTNILDPIVITGLQRTGYICLKL